MDKSNHSWLDTADKGRKCKNWDCPCGVEYCDKHLKVISACNHYLDGKEIDCFICKDFEED